MLARGRSGGGDRRTPPLAPRRDGKSGESDRHHRPGRSLRNHWAIRKGDANIVTVPDQFIRLARRQIQNTVIDKDSISIAEILRKRQIGTGYEKQVTPRGQSLTAPS